VTLHDWKNPCHDHHIDWISRQQSTGVSIAKTNQAVLIGEYAEGTQPGDATTVVEKLADYLKGVGY
jgi:Profilin